jgi:hypothetical protein
MNRRNSTFNRGSLLIGAAVGAGLAAAISQKYNKDPTTR